MKQVLTEQLVIRVTPALVERLQAIAEAEDRKPSAAARRMLEAGVSDWETKNKRKK
jgi:predicted transcriptional regulator